MTVSSVGIISPGDMGHEIGAMLGRHGLTVRYSQEGRSARTRALAAEAGIAPVPDLAALVHESDILLSVLVPAEAVGVAEQVAEALRAAGPETAGRRLYVDCNAVSPGTVARIAGIIQATGAQFADAGIVGSPPKKPGTTRFYASGPGAGRFAELGQHGLDMRVLDGPVGQASGLKMCYGALTKGMQALGTELLLAARLLGLEDVLAAEQRSSVPELREYLERALPSYPPKAYRWVGEMEEIATTFAELGLTPLIFKGAADLFRFVAETPVGKETPETRDTSRDLSGVIEVLAAAAEPD